MTSPHVYCHCAHCANTVSISTFCGTRLTACTNITDPRGKMGGGTVISRPLYTSHSGAEGPTCSQSRKHVLKSVLDAAVQFRVAESARS
jgi:hypothetical protein